MFTFYTFQNTIKVNKANVILNLKCLSDVRGIMYKTCQL